MLPPRNNVVEKKDVFEAEAILDHKRPRNNLQYFVPWKAYPEDDNSYVNKMSPLWSSSPLRSEVAGPNLATSPMIFLLRYSTSSSVDHQLREHIRLLLGRLICEFAANPLDIVLIYLKRPPECPLEGRSYASVQRRYVPRRGLLRTRSRADSVCLWLRCLSARSELMICSRGRARRASP